MRCCVLLTISSLPMSNLSPKLWLSTSVEGSSHVTNIGAPQMHQGLSTQCTTALGHAHPTHPCTSAGVPCVILRGRYLRRTVACVDAVLLQAQSRFIVFAFIAMRLDYHICLAAQMRAPGQGTTARPSCLQLTNIQVFEESR